MEKVENIVYAKEVLEFVTVANEYAGIIELHDEFSLKDFIGKAHQILPELYFRSTRLPDLSPEFEELNQRFVNEEDYESLLNNLLQKFGEYDSFEEVFDQNRLEGDESVSESIAENLTDIYQDTKDFVLLYEIGTHEVMYEAIWELRQSFEQYWGQKLVNTLRAIHLLRFTSEEIEENKGNTQENTNFSTTDKTGWFISRRQEDFRDEQ